MTGALGVAVYREETRQKRDQQRHERNQLQEHERDEEHQRHKESDAHREPIMKTDLRQRLGGRYCDGQRRGCCRGLFLQARIVILGLSTLVAESGIRR